MLRYLTPDTPTGDTVCRSFVVPVELLHLFMGALDILTRPEIYESFGTMTPEELSQEFMVILANQRSIEGVCNMGMGEVSWLVYHPTNPGHPFLLCDGSTYLKADYPDYWNWLVANNADGVWGVDTSSFRLPNLCERFLRGTGDEPGGEGGEDTVTLTTGQIPAHTHTEIIAGSILPVVAPGEVPAVTTGAPGITGSTGGGGSHNNMPAYTNLLPYIRVEF